MRIAVQQMAVERHQRHQFVNARADPRFAPARQPRYGGDILRHGTMGKERGALHHEADLAADLDNISVSEADALNIDVAAVGNIQLVNHAQDSRFSAAARADEGAEFAMINIQTEVANGRLGAAWIGFAKMR